METLKEAGWTVRRATKSPAASWLMEIEENGIDPGPDPLAALEFLRKILQPPLWVPTSRNVLAHTVIGQGQLAIICSSERALLSECLHAPDGAPIQVDVGVASLDNPRRVFDVFRDAIMGSSVNAVRFVVEDIEGDGLFLDFPLKTVALVVGLLAKEDHEMPQVSQQEDPGPADDTKH